MSPNQRQHERLFLIQMSAIYFPSFSTGLDDNIMTFPEMTF